MIGLIDLGLGNIKSIDNAFKFIGAETRILEKAEDLENMEAIVLPGVGAFGKGCEALDSGSWRYKIRTAVLDRGIPILGICLGMQLLAKTSEETLGYTGLTLVEGGSCLIPSDNKEIKVPHIGWNDVEIKNKSILFDEIDDPVYYFLHSYYVKLSDPKIVSAITNYGSEITAGFSSENIFGVQFHPEKSQESGLQILRNFCNIKKKVKC